MVRAVTKKEQLIATLLATQAIAATQASSFSDELGSAKSELASYMSAIELDRRWELEMLRRETRNGGRGGGGGEGGAAMYTRPQFWGEIARKAVYVCDGNCYVERVLCKIIQ